MKTPTLPIEKPGREIAWVSDDGDPSLLVETPGRGISCWQVSDFGRAGFWHEHNPAPVCCYGRLMSKMAFDRMWPALPPLPVPLPEGSFTWGVFGGDPFVLVETPGSIRAWLVKDSGKADAWSEVSPTEPALGGAVLPKHWFDGWFPSLPDLPREALEA